MMGAGKNKEEIDLDDMDDDAEEEEKAPAGNVEVEELEEVAVPDEVFGKKLKEKVAEGAGDGAETADGEAEAAPVGAKDRFKKRQRVQV